MHNSQPTYAFDDPVPTRQGRKHRRGRGYGVSLGRKNNASRGAAAQQQQQQQQAGTSFRLGGQPYLSAAQPQAQATHYAASGFDNGPSYNRGGGNGKNNEENSCTGSLTYSASSSVQSAESSNDSSFADIMRLVDVEGEGASEIKEFMAKQSKAASDYNQFGQEVGGTAKIAAVQGWNKRNQQAREAMQVAQAQKIRQQKQQQQQYSMAAGKHIPNAGNVDFNYSKDDSSASEDDVFSLDFDEKVLETIGGLDRDDDMAPARHNVIVTSQGKSQQGNNDPFRKAQATRQQDPFHSPSSSPYKSAPSSPRSGPSSSGHVTPPPNSRHNKRTSTPPGAQPISRTSSRHSKSSSDGSWDTPAPASPPQGGAGGGHGPRPPHSRSVPVGKSRRKSGSNDKAVTDLSVAFYAKSWMCGFADALNLDGKL